MSFDRHLLWRRVKYDYEQLLQSAPEGYEPRVQVFLRGRAEPVLLGFVETHRGPNDPWVRFESADPSGGDLTPDGPLPTGVYWIHVHESMVERVEITFDRIQGNPVGFNYRDSAAEQA